MDSKFLLRPPRLDAAARVFCLPYAGAGAVAYRSLPKLLPSTIDVCAVELPGRGARRREAHATELAGVVKDLAEHLRPHLDLPFALFGYSLGAVIAFELARELRKSGLPAPVHLFVAARQAPHHPHPPETPRHDLPVNALLERLRVCYGRGLDPALLAEPELVEMLVEILRADLRLLESYCYQAAAPLDCPITVFVGERDPSTAREELLDWQRQTLASCDIQRFSGRTHFFLEEEADALARRIVEALRSRVPSDHAPRARATPDP